MKKSIFFLIFSFLILSGCSSVEKNTVSINKDDPKYILEQRRQAYFTKIEKEKEAQLRAKEQAEKAKIEKEKKAEELKQKEAKLKAEKLAKENQAKLEAQRNKELSKKVTVKKTEKKVIEKKVTKPVIKKEEVKKIETPKPVKVLSYEEKNEQLLKEIKAKLK